MRKYVYHRIVGHVLTAYLQVTYFLEVLKKLDEALPTHPELKEFASLLTRFLTLWNVFYQVVYAFVAFLCDVTTALNVESIVPKWVRYHRYTFGNAFLFPLSTAVFCFWGWFLYDRELILPKIFDIAISPTCNILWHLAVVIYGLWEMAFLGRDAPMPSTSLKLLITSNCSYIAILFYTRYGDIGVWPYGLLKIFEGSFIQYIIIGKVFAVTIVAYFIQFRLRKFIWKIREKKKD